MRLRGQLFDVDLIPDVGAATRRSWFRKNAGEPFLVGSKCRMDDTDG
jgi:hypothetical protein